MQKKFKQPVSSIEPKISDLEGSFEENSKTFQKKSQNQNFYISDGQNFCSRKHYAYSHKQKKLAETRSENWTQTQGKAV